MKKDIRILIYSLLVIGAFLMLSTSCKKDDNNNDSSSSGTVKDVDGNIYHTVTIGSQVWMVENLKTTKYRDGESIPNVTENKQWSELTTGAYCNYDNDETIGKKYGKLYNWYAVNDSRNLAPSGWHVPTDAEWRALENYVAANLGNSGTEAKALAAKIDWDSGNEIGDDLTKNNSSGFTALPGGLRWGIGEWGGNGHFANIGYFGYWWSYTSIGSAWDRIMSNDQDYAHSYDESKTCGFSVRCIKD